MNLISVIGQTLVEIYIQQKEDVSRIQKEEAVISHHSRHKSQTNKGG